MLALAYVHGNFIFCSSTKRQIDSNYKEVYYYDNEEVSFRCVGNGYPTPSLLVHTLTLLPATSWCVL